VQCIGLKRVGQHLMRLVDTIVAERSDEPKLKRSRPAIARTAGPRRAR
jgi:hypothetical protein